jgi:hypothetical protein
MHRLIFSEILNIECFCVQYGNTIEALSHLILLQPYKGYAPILILVLRKAVTHSGPERVSNLPNTTQQLSSRLGV